MSQAESLPVSAAHSLFGKQCSRCHEPFRGPSEKLCQECHAGPVHNQEQAFTPACASCHVEHQDQPELARVPNEQCVTCHADLKIKDGKPSRFAKKITDFTQGHPEFAVTVKDGPNQKRLRLDEPEARQSDTAKIKFTHEEHLKAGLKSPKGPVQLVCKDCHIPAANGRQMAPVSYQGRCKDCHELVFDPQFPNRFVPHVPPEDVHAYLLMTFAERRDERPPAPERAGRLTRPAPSPAPSALTPGVFQRVQAAERLLYEVTCNKCHEVDKSHRPLPRIVKTAIPAAWLPYARFEHKAHRMLECASCHEDVAKSKQVADVLLPGIQVCRECHRAATQEAVAQQQSSATTDCVACHLYHDKSQDVDWNGPFTVKRVLTEGEPEKAKSRSVPGEARP